MIKNQIVEAIEATFSLLKDADADVFNVSYVVRANHNVNKIEVLFMEFLNAVIDIPIVYTDEFKMKYSTAQLETKKYAKINEEETPAELVFDIKVPDMIVHEPNGSQSWPDIMVIKDNVGYPLEIKTSKSVPKMNSGIFRLNTPYVAIKKKDDNEKRMFRFILGSEMCTSDEIISWRKIEEEIKETFNKNAEKRNPTSRTDYDRIFKSSDWFPKDTPERHNEAVKKYIS